ncbi:hypothetical protein RF11_00752 [Thelohanellus kitauei]|uniref:Uncharacterized protein n=1 Tax=Thelohanellus kitauei TaxID=669202 RepID=A0A0C2NAA0_THEKT|nr:hypothetical protein RF11_00752 [Thelohanellus kitauei]
MFEQEIKAIAEYIRSKKEEIHHVIKKLISNYGLIEEYRLYYLFYINESTIEINRLLLQKQKLYNEYKEIYNKTHVVQNRKRVLQNKLHVQKTILNIIKMKIQSMNSGRHQQSGKKYSIKKRQKA